ncbi:DUF3833 family protein [Ascidiaceihabitans sp.]|uniref:DUF3833 family protein n=1 Tax=Ascidiaceihabitans sp. TaxID=1872644 RepID=UPI00329A4A3F
MDGIFYVIAGVAIVLLLNWVRQRYASFVAQSPDDYAQDDTQFDVRRHLNGPIVCEGVIYGPLGRVTSRFVGEFDCEWTGNSGVMREHFRYHDGSTQDRQWNLSLGNDGRIKATASDVVGEGMGVQLGASVQLKYRFQLPDSAGGHVLDTVDWMYLAPNGTIVNRSQFRKFGIKVAELVATMRPAEQTIKEAA